MTMRPGEQEALDAAKAKVADKRASFFDYARDLDRMSATDLASCGYRNGNADAVHRAFKNAQKECDKIWADFVKQYPDK